MKELLIQIFLFLYISFAVSFVWVGITGKQNRIVKETFKTFGLFVTFALILGTIVILIS